MISRELIAQYICIAEKLQKRKTVRCFQHCGNFYPTHFIQLSLGLVMVIKTTGKNEHHYSLQTRIFFKNLHFLIAIHSHFYEYFSAAVLLASVT